MMFQRTKIVLDAYQSKKQEYRALQKIVGNKRFEGESFLAPSFLSGKAHSEAQEAPVDDIEVLNNGIIGLLQKDRQSSSENSAEDIEIEVVDVDVNDEINDSKQNEDHADNMLHKRNNLTQKLMKQTEDLDIYQGFTITHYEGGNQASERLSYIELEQRGLLPEYNCMPDQLPLVQDEVEYILKSIQRLDLANDEDLRDQRLLQLLHNWRQTASHIHALTEKLESANAELMAQKMKEDSITQLKRRQESLRHEHKEESQSKDQRIEELLEMTNQLHAQKESYQIECDELKKKTRAEQTQLATDKENMLEYQAKLEEKQVFQIQRIDSLTVENKQLGAALDEQLQQTKKLHLQIQELQVSREWQAQIYERLYSDHQNAKEELERLRTEVEEMSEEVFHYELINKNLQN